MTTLNTCHHPPCGQCFDGRQGKRYCSRACKENARKARRLEPVTHCTWCACPLPTKSPGQQRYCSPGCAWAAQARQIRVAAEREGVLHPLELRCAYLRERTTARGAADYTRALRADPCAYCGQPAGTVDHIIPTSAGGPDVTFNLTAACASCNSRKHGWPLLLFLLRRAILEAISEPLEQLERLQGVGPLRIAGPDPKILTPTPRHEKRSSQLGGTP